MKILALVIICAFDINIGNGISDPYRCIFKKDDRLADLKKEYCSVEKHDVNLACPRSKEIILSKVHLAIKHSDDSCTKRVLASNDFYCCSHEQDDTLYDADCLQDVWSTEDTLHYQQFMGYILQKCAGKSHCSLKSDMFENLQTEIPATRKYASYIQISHQCIKEPQRTVDVCSSKTANGKEIHLKSSVSTRVNVNETCTCRMTSVGGQNVVIKAVDVRVRSTGLILKSENRLKDLSVSLEPLFGFREIFTDQIVEVSVTKRHKNTDNRVWLHVSGSKGQEIQIVCKGPQQKARVQPVETTTTIKSTPIHASHETPAVRELEDKDQDEDSNGYWPIIYLAAGSGITFVVVVCIIGSVLICRCSLKNGKRDHGYSYPYHQSQVSYHKNGQYDTVLDDNMMTSQSEPYEWPHAFVK